MTNNMTILLWCTVNYFSRRIAAKMQEEANILANLRHGNIVPCLGILWSPNLYALAMGLAVYGSLKTFSEDHKISHKLKVNIIKLCQYILNFLTYVN